MAKTTKKPRIFTLAQKAEILGEVSAVRGSLAAAARKHGVGEATLHAWKKAHPEWVGKALVPASNGKALVPASNGNAVPAPPPPPSRPPESESKGSGLITITGLTGIVRDQVRADLRTVVREELQAMFAGKS